MQFKNQGVLAEFARQVALAKLTNFMKQMSLINNGKNHKPVITQILKKHATNLQKTEEKITEPENKILKEGDDAHVLINGWTLGDAGSLSYGTHFIINESEHWSVNSTAKMSHQINISPDSKYSKQSTSPVSFKSWSKELTGMEVDETKLLLMQNNENVGACGAGGVIGDEKFNKASIFIALEVTVLEKVVPENVSSPNMPIESDNVICEASG